MLGAVAASVRYCRAAPGVAAGNVASLAVAFRSDDPDRELVLKLTNERRCLLDST
jgi:hypothetical protein